MKTIFWDIECTDLDAHWARILTIGLKPQGKKALVLVNQSILKEGAGRSNDRNILVAARDILEEFDLIVSYYGGHWRFDLPMLNTRLLVYGEKPLSPKFHLDLYSVAKKSLRFKRLNLAIIAKFFGIGELKTQIDPNDWVEAAMDGSRKALKEIIRHNKGDVEILDKLFPKLIPFVRGIRREG